jgi:hypothetical protein
MTSNLTHGKFEDILQGVSPGLGQVCKALRKLITNLDPEFVEIIWPNQKIASFGVGPKKMSEHYAYIGVQESHVNLGFYHGTSLLDPHKVLEGNGKKLRHIKLHEPAVVEGAPIAALLREAIDDRKRLKG